MNIYPKLQELQNTTVNSTTEMSDKISIEVANNILTKFDGTKSKLYEFIDNCDEAMSIIKETSKSTLFSLIKTKLTDNARFLVRNRHFENWIGLREYLLETYSDKRTMNQWQLELSSCRQNINETITSYSSKIENCYLRLVNSLENDLTVADREACTKLLKKQALIVFLAGLQKDYAILVKSQRPSTLEDAVSIALAEEQEFKSKNEIFKYQSVNQNNAKFCNFCNKPGHTSFYCRKNNNQNIRYINTNGSESNNQNRKTTTNSSNNRTKFCNYCKKNGHEIKECRKLEYKNKMRNNAQNNSSTSNNNNLNMKIPRQTVMSRNTNLIQAESHSSNDQ